MGVVMVVALARFSLFSYRSDSLWCKVNNLNATGTKNLVYRQYQHSCQQT
jgi:hypothetical protein